MKRKNYFWKILVIGAICLLLLPSIQGSIANVPGPKIKNAEDDDNVEPKGTTQFSNCVVWIYGNCKTVTGALTWIFGIFSPLFKKNLLIQAKGQENESLNVIVTQDGLATYFDQENIKIELSGTTGILYWYGKSLILEGDQIFARCKAENLSLIHI